MARRRHGKGIPEAHNASESKSIPMEVVTRILSFMQVLDLLRFCLVCKDWKNTILSSDYFHQLHSQLCRPEKGILGLEPHGDKGWYFRFPKTREGFCNGIGPLHFHASAICCHDKGLVCTYKVVRCNDNGEVTMKVEIGNPILNSWKVIPSPPLLSYPMAMSVEESGSYLILATERVSGRLLINAHVFDSRMKGWRKAATLDWNHAPQGEEISSALVINRFISQLAFYSFEKDCWSINSLPPTFDFTHLSLDMICVPYKGSKSIFVECKRLHPFLRLWECSDEVNSWKLRDVVEGAQICKWLKGCDAMADFTSWQPLLTLGKDDTIFVIVENFSSIFVLKKELAKQLVKGSWQLLKVPSLFQFLKQFKIFAPAQPNVIVFTPSFFQP